MNNRRQTIWLVSMLSLMVILSAYYLFTEPVNPSQNASNETQQTKGGADSAKASGSADDVQVSEVDDPADSLTDPAAGDAADSKDAASAEDTSKDAGVTDPGNKDAAGDHGKADEKTGGKAVSKDDETVLKDMTNLQGVRYFDEMKRTSMENLQRKIEELNAVVADTKSHSPEQAADALKQMSSLQDTDDRITDLETQLLQDYENAVVTQEDARNFKIVVQSAELDRKKAVQIIDKAAKELQVTPDRLSVQFVP